MLVTEDQVQNNLYSWSDHFFCDKSWLLNCIFSPLLFIVCGESALLTGGNTFRSNFIWQLARTWDFTEFYPLSLGSKRHLFSVFAERKSKESIECVKKRKCCHLIKVSWCSKWKKIILMYPLSPEPESSQTMADCHFYYKSAPGRILRCP